MLEVAHIASGQGKARRVDDARAVILLCSLCHRLHVSNSDTYTEMRIAGHMFPTFDERHSLYVKWIMDPEFYDEEFLKGIWIGNLPEKERPPRYYSDRMADNIGLCI